MGGGEGVKIGYKGKGVTLHLLVEALGRPIAISTTPANGDERKEVETLLDQLPTSFSNVEMPIVEADKGYDAEWLRQRLFQKGFFPIISRRKVGVSSEDKPDANTIRTYFGVKKLKWSPKLGPPAKLIAS